MLDTYRAALEVRNYQESSLNKNVQLAGQFLRNAQISDPQEITVCNVEEYLIQLRAKGRSAKTIKKHRTAIKVFCDFLTNRGMLNENPVHKIPSMDLPVEVPVFQPDDEVEKLYQIATQQGMLCVIPLPRVQQSEALTSGSSETGWGIVSSKPPCSTSTSPAGMTRKSNCCKL
jgi:site-specific recombinase XerD